MFTLTKSFSFEASHILPHHNGKCARLHGHSWKGHVTVGGEVLHVRGPQTGMLIDYYILGVAVKEMVEQFLDHHHLNDSTGLADPTSEMLAMWIFGRLNAFTHMTESGVEIRLCDYLKSVTIDETCTSSCTYEPFK